MNWVDAREIANKWLVTNNDILDARRIRNSNVLVKTITKFPFDLRMFEGFTSWEMETLSKLNKEYGSNSYYDFFVTELRFTGIDEKFYEFSFLGFSKNDEYARELTLMSELYPIDSDSYNKLGKIAHCRSKKDSEVETSKILSAYEAITFMESLSYISIYREDYLNELDDKKKWFIELNSGVEEAGESFLETLTNAQKSLEDKKGQRQEKEAKKKLVLSKLTEEERELLGL